MGEQNHVYACRAWGSGDIISNLMSIARILLHINLTYRIDGNIGGDLNLAVWQSGKRPPNLNPSNLNLFRVRAYYMCARRAYRQI